MTLSGHILVRGVFAYKPAYQDLLVGACLFFFSFFLLLVSLNAINENYENCCYSKLSSGQK